LGALRRERKKKKVFSVFLARRKGNYDRFQKIFVCAPMRPMGLEKVGTTSLSHGGKKDDTPKFSDCANPLHLSIKKGETSANKSCMEGDLLASHVEEGEKDSPVSGHRRSGGIVSRFSGELFAHLRCRGRKRGMKDHAKAECKPLQ